MARLKCLIWGHDYRIWQAFTPYSRRIYCERCQQDWGMLDDTESLVRWDSEIADMYRLLGYTVRTREGNVNSNDFKAGDRVRYVPMHAHGNQSHPDCENGIVSSTNDKYVFVRYYYKAGGLRENGQATDPLDLVKT